MKPAARRRERKAERYALVAALHAAGIRDTGAIAKVLLISREYARLILHDLGLPLLPRTRLGLMAMLDTELRLRADICAHTNDLSAGT